MQRVKNTSLYFPGGNMVKSFPYYICIAAEMYKERMYCSQNLKIAQLQANLAPKI